MSVQASGQVVLVCCSVLRAELEILREEDWPGLPTRTEDSMLHMRPAHLAERLGAVVGEELGAGRKVLLVYGDCCDRMTSLVSRPGVARTRGRNCCEILLGRDEYRRLMREGVFFVLPEWASRWKEVFRFEMGLDHDNATSLMQEMHRKLVYLDTGTLPIPEAALRDCSEYCGLPFEVKPVSLGALRVVIQEAFSRLVGSGAVA